MALKIKQGLTFPQITFLSKFKLYQNYVHINADFDEKKVMLSIGIQNKGVIFYYDLKGHIRPLKLWRGAFFFLNFQISNINFFFKRL